MLMARSLQIAITLALNIESKGFFIVLIVKEKKKKGEHAFNVWALTNDNCIKNISGWLG